MPGFRVVQDEVINSLICSLIAGPRLITVTPCVPVTPFVNLISVNLLVFLCRPYEYRISQLKSLERMIEENMEDFVAALKSDLGRSDFEAREKAKQTSDPGPMGLAYLFWAFTSTVWSATLPSSDEIITIIVQESSY